MNLRSVLIFIISIQRDKWQMTAYILENNEAKKASRKRASRDSNNNEKSRAHLHWFLFLKSIQSSLPIFPKSSISPTVISPWLSSTKPSLFFLPSAHGRAPPVPVHIDICSLSRILRQSHTFGKYKMQRVVSSCGAVRTNTTPELEGGSGARPSQ